MNSLLTSFTIIHWMLLGIGTGLLGLFALLVGSIVSPVTARRLGWTTLAVLGVATGAAVWLSESYSATVLGVCFALWTLGALLRTESFRATSSAGLRWLGHARLQAALLLALAPAAVGMAVYQEAAEQHGIDELNLCTELPVNLAAADAQAYTDQGTLVDIFYVVDAPDPRLTEREVEFLSRPPAKERVIRTGPASTETNCHGWVFTAGQYWIKGGSVDRILQDNGYEEVCRPQVGDVAVYRDEAGTVLHTALVRMVHEDGTILLESKWGQFGRFIHAPEDQSYAPEPMYYHSDRQGHVLRGLEKPYKPTPATTTAG